MKYFSLFSGVAGGDLAFQHLLEGFRCVGYVEIEEYPRKVIKQRIKDGLLDAAPIFTDIKQFVSEGYAEAYKGMVDLVTGGFPCQDISCAGKGAGIEGERSGLWSEMAEVVRQVRPKYVFVENSPMLTIRGLGTVLGDLAKMGFNARWGCISAADVGAVHKRNRIWIVSYSECGRARGVWKREVVGQNKREVGNERYRKLATVFGRFNDVAYWMDRKRAIGNGQVPQCAATAWRILSGMVET